MAKVHLICRKQAGGGLIGLTPVDIPNHVYASEAWDFSADEARRLIGGQIYLHQSKADLSQYGGNVTQIHVVETDKPQTTRVKFTFVAMREARGVPWSGACHTMAWTSGILD